MSLNLKRELLIAFKEQYQEADMKQRSKVLDSFVAATGYNRKYAIVLLSQSAKQARVKRNRSAKYDSEVQDYLLQVWRAAGYICSKRLVPFLPDFIPILERCRYLTISDTVREKLLRISPATADRLLKFERKRLGRSISTTRAGSLLRQQIAVRSFADWDSLKPGFLEVDLVAHNGGNSEGQCVHTFTLTDVASGWTELQALLNKGEDQVLAALPRVRRLLPIDILGFDSDNGGEFINYKVAEYCQAENITFTRSREYKKNDQAFVEEKNGSVVRRLVGYERIEGETACNLLASLYRAARLYVNYFQPSLKLAAKTRIGGRVKKQYHSAKTPCQRLLESDIPEPNKAKLRRSFATLDPIALLGRIELIQSELARTVSNSSRELTVTVLPCSGPSLPTTGSDLQPLSHLVPAKRTKRKQPSKPRQKKVRTKLLSNKTVSMIYQMLKDAPGLNATDIIPLLNKRVPGSFEAKHRRTVARTINLWREAHPEHFALFPTHYRIRNKKSDCQGLIIDESTQM